MGRNNNQGHSKNKGGLPQTPKNQKIAPSQVDAEFSQEIADLGKSSSKNNSFKNNKA